MSQRQGDTGCVGGQLSHQSPCASVALARRARRGQHAPTCKRLDSSLSPSKSRRRRRTLHHHLHACAECTRDRWQHSCHAMPCPWIASADTSLLLDHFTSVSVCLPTPRRPFPSSRLILRQLCAIIRWPSSAVLGLVQRTTAAAAPAHFAPYRLVPSSSSSSSAEECRARLLAVRQPPL